MARLTSSKQPATKAQLELCRKLIKAGAEKVDYTEFTKLEASRFVQGYPQLMQDMRTANIKRSKK